MHPLLFAGFYRRFRLDPYANFSRPRLVLLADGAENQAYLAEKLPFMETVVRIEDKATAYVCSGFTCKMPVTDPNALRLQLEEQQPGH